MINHLLFASPRISLVFSGSQMRELGPHILVICDAGNKDTPSRSAQDEWRTTPGVFLIPAVAIYPQVSQFISKCVAAVPKGDVVYEATEAG